jgi:hypothetical protein
MAKEVCVLFVCDNFPSLLVQSFMHKLLYVQSYVHKALCVNLLLYAKLKDNGLRQVMSQI